MSKNRTKVIICMAVLVIVLAVFYVIRINSGSGHESDDTAISDKELSEESSDNMDCDEQDIIDAGENRVSELENIMEGVYEGEIQHEQTVYDCETIHEYVEAGIAVNSQRVWSDVEEITIDTEKGTVTDQNGNTVSDCDPLISYIAETAPENATELLEKAGYKKTGENEGIIIVDNIFRTKTLLILHTDDPVTDDLALSIIHYGTTNEMYYATVKETAVSYRGLLSKGYDVMVSDVIKVEDDA